VNYDEIYKPHPKQLTVHQDHSRFRVLVCGRRFGKTTFAVNELIVSALKEKDRMCWYVAPTYRQAKQIAWRMLNQYLPPKVALKSNESTLEIKLFNGSFIALKGADNPDSLRGVGIDFLVVDEVATIRHWDWLWQEVLRATIMDTGGRAIFIGTPKGFNHFYRLYTNKNDEGGQLFESHGAWRFKSSDNPHLPTGEYDAAKKELAVDTFEQEYNADFRKYTGLVYKAFDQEIHIIEPFDIPDTWTVYRGFDFGSTNPTACLWIGVDGDDNWFVVAEHYESRQTIDYHAGVVNAHRLSKRVGQSFGDPSGAQWIQEFQDRGIYITPADRETGQSQEGWVRIGIEKVAEALKPLHGHKVARVERPDQALPRLFIFSTCTNTIKEFETYRWREKAQTAAEDLNEPEQPEKANDHAMDALRYFAVSYKKPTLAPAKPQWRPEQWRIGI
jgi:phage terminase large subunit